MRSALNRLFWEMKYQWKIQYVLPLLIFLPIFVMIWRDPFDTESNNGSGKAVVAQITYVGPERGRDHGLSPGMRVKAKTEDGAIGTTIASPERVTGCEIGDSIRAEQKGFKLYLHPEPCAK